jgi:hypothetical protein
VFKDSRQQLLTQGEFVLNKIFGSFDLLLKLPENMNLGDASLVLEIEQHEGSEYTHVLGVQEVVHSSV